MMNRVERYYEAHPTQILRRSHNVNLLLPPPPLEIINPARGGANRGGTWSGFSGPIVKQRLGSTNSADPSLSTFSVLERGERIKPERIQKRNNVQNLQWKASRWAGGFPGSGAYGEELDSRIGSMTIADVSPRVAVKRIILLYENFQYREAANFINRLNHGTFKVILNDLPIDLFVESMPHSLSILEALYAKVFLSDGLNFSLKLLRPDAVVLQMTKFFSNDIDKADKWEQCGSFVCSCKKLLKVIVLSDPKVKKMIQSRKRGLEKAIEGLGQHGLVGTSDETLMNLHDALKVEFQTVVDTYKGALQKLEELSLSSGKKDLHRTIRGPAPVEASHQRQLSLKQLEIQERLIKNKTLLNVVEPTLGNHSLDILLGILQRRIEYDKDVLFQFTQLKKEDTTVEASTAVAPVLMRYSNGCEKVLELMKEVADDDDDSSDISGYHSDSDSAIMMSGNSPFVSKRARYKFLTRSVRSVSKNSMRPSLLHLGSSSSGSPPASLSPSGEEKDKESCSGSSSSGIGSSQGPTRLRQLKHKKLSATSAISWTQPVPSCDGCNSRAMLQVSPPPPNNSSEIAVLREEIAGLRAELSRSHSHVAALQENEKQLKDTIARVNAPVYQEVNIQSGDRFVQYYANLYTKARVDTLDALDGLQQLNNCSELKNKILFSVIVLSFRSTQALLATKKDHLRRILHLPQVCESTNAIEINGVKFVEADQNVAELERSVAHYLRKTADKFDLSKSVEDVCNQIWATLYDYPCLKSCKELLQYVRDATRLSWNLINQNPPYVLEYDQRIFRKEMHVRYQHSNPEKEDILTYLWPALLEGKNGPCVYKAVVVT